MATDREQSRKNWTCNDTVEHLSFGCLQRIADATEAMAKRHTELMQERDDYKVMYEYNQNSVDRLRRRVAALRGHITRMKREARGREG